MHTMLEERTPRRLAPSRPKRSAVQVGKQHGIGVSESLGGHLRWDATGQHQRGTGVAQTVSREAGQSHLTCVNTKKTRKPLRVLQAPDASGEDELAFYIPYGRQMFLGLQALLRSEHVEQAGDQGRVGAGRI